MFSAARWRLTIVFTAVLAVILITSGVVVYLTTRSVLFDRVDSDLQERAHRDLSLLTREPPPPPRETSSDFDFIPREFTTSGYFYAKVDAHGQVISSSPNVDPQGLAPGDTLSEAAQTGEAFASTESSQGDSLRVYVLSPNNSHGSDVLVQIGRSTDPEEAALSQLRTVLLAVLGVSIVPAVVGGFLLSGRALRPIKAAMDSQRTFIADASHELRTPVAVVQTNAELLKRHMKWRRAGRSADDVVALEDILSESDRLGRMVDQMLTLAQADAGQERLSPSDVELNELAEETARSMKALAEARGIVLDTRTNGQIQVRGDRERLRELLVILLDNAIKYTDAGGRVELAVDRTQKRAMVEVTDTGRGIPSASLPNIFDRFYRVDKARSRESGGTGLGLAIARHIAEAHDGSIHIESKEGKGTTVTVALPA